MADGRTAEAERTGSRTNDPVVHERVEQTESDDLLYTVDDVSPWHICTLLGFQQYLAVYTGNLAVPLLLAPALCMSTDTRGLSQLIATLSFVSGLSSLLQTVVGSRLPLLQGGNFSFIVPALSIYALPRWTCPYTDPSFNESSLPEIGSEQHQEMWKSRLREFQGCLILSSMLQAILGFSGLFGILLRFVRPLTIVSTITVIGLSLLETATVRSSSHWWIAFSVIVLIAIFSQYLQRFSIPCAGYSRGNGCTRVNLPVFKIFPVLIAILLCWLICFILTVSGALPSTKGEWGYEARTDIKTAVFHSSAWLRFPYPGQWGTPTVSVAGVFSVFAGTLASVIEIVGQYYTCAEIAGVQPPPMHAINRGIGVDGISNILAGAWGSPTGTIPFSEIFATISITKVASRRVIQVAGIILIIMGCFEKMGSVFIALPEPVIGGLFVSTFGMLTAVGLSNLQHVKLNSSRNLFVLGSSLYIALVFPNWVFDHGSHIKTGNSTVDQVFVALLGNSIFVAGFVSLLLDNTIPGNAEEKKTAFEKFHNTNLSTDGSSRTPVQTYNLPLIQDLLDKASWTRVLPFCPSFVGFGRGQLMRCNSRVEDIPVRVTSLKTVKSTTEMVV